MLGKHHLADDFIIVHIGPQRRHADDDINDRQRCPDVWQRRCSHEHGTTTSHQAAEHNVILLCRRLHHTLLHRVDNFVVSTDRDRPIQAK